MTAYSTEQEKIQLGIQKKSFSIFYHNGEIWCEHLDSMGADMSVVLEKFQGDLPMIRRPSGSSYININLYETQVDEDTLGTILYTLRDMNKVIRKVVFVGLSKQNKKALARLEKNSERPIGFVIGCVDDYDKSKAWLIP